MTQIIRPHKAGVRHGNEVDVFELPSGSSPDADHVLDKAVSKFPDIINHLVTACKVERVRDANGVYHDIDNSKPLFLVRRRSDEMDTETRNLLEKNQQFAQKVFESKPPEKEIGNGKIILNN
jgi:hypothetical protein